MQFHLLRRRRSAVDEDETIYVYLNFEEIEFSTFIYIFIFLKQFFRVTT